MKILYHVDDLKGTFTNQFLYNNFSDGFRAIGHDVESVTFADDFAAKLKSSQPDVIITFTYRTYFEHVDFKALAQAKASGIRVIVWTEPLPGFNYDDYDVSADKRKLDAIASGNWGDAYVSCLDSPDFDRAFKEKTGAAHHPVALACNPKIHFPEEHERTYDVAYVGNRLPRKENLFQSVLFPLKKTRNVAIRGYNWSLLDRAVNKFNRECRKRNLQFPEIKTSNVITLGQERALYSSSKACLNFHEDAQIRLGIDVNERTFKVPACGGFEISDNPLAVRKYYADDEVATVDSMDGWHKTIDYYLSDAPLREKMQAKATARTHKEHTYPIRCKQMLSLVGK